MKALTDDIRKIGIFRALYLGDMLCAIPALRALRRACPRAEITLIGLPWAAPFARRFHDYLDRFISFPGYPGLPEQVPDTYALQQFLENIRKEKFDLVIQMQGNGTVVNDLLQLFGARYTAGFYPENETDPPSKLFIPYPGHVSEIERHLQLAAFLGAPKTGARLEFPVTDHDRGDFKNLALPPDKEYICIHPGSRSPLRRWPLKYFAQAADYCIARGYAAVITGAKEEMHLSGEMQKYMKGHAVDLAGKTSLGAAALVIKRSLALISNCTGVSHIADALNTPGIVISMDGEPERWHPADRKLQHVIDWKKQPHFGEAFNDIATFINKLEKTKHRKQTAGKCQSAMPAL